MRVAVVGSTGLIGRLVVDELRRTGHEARAISRADGVDAYTGAGLDAALVGGEAVIDVSNTSAPDEPGIVDFFGTVTANLLAAEERAGVRHHVLLSIVGIDRGQQVPHYAGKREQERLIAAGPVPWSVVRATQFHGFAEQVVGWSERDGVAAIPPLLVQPVAPVDVARELVAVAVGEPLGRWIDLAGPETQDLVDLARRTLAVRGRAVRLVPTWRAGFGLSMAGEVLLPGPDARIGEVTFDEWLADSSA